MNWLGVAVLGPLLSILVLQLVEMARLLGEIVRGGPAPARDDEEDEEAGASTSGGALLAAGFFAPLLAAGDAGAAWLLEQPVVPALLAGAAAGLTGGAVVGWLVRRAWAMGPIAWLAPFLAANAAACWVALG